MKRAKSKAEWKRLFDQLQMRHGVYAATRRFLKDHQAKAGPGWAGIAACLMRSSGLTDAYSDFVLRTLMSTTKKAFLFRVEKKSRSMKDMIAAAPRLPKSVSPDALSVAAPRRRRGVIPCYLNTQRVEGVDVHTFVTTRRAFNTEKLTIASLSEEIRDAYDPADQVLVKQTLNVRCYDHVLVSGDYGVLLLDTPGRVLSEYVSSDVTSYASALASQLGVEEPWLNLFPAVEEIFFDGEEGILTEVGFESDYNAKIGGDYTQRSAHCLRDHDLFAEPIARARANPELRNYGGEQTEEKGVLVFPYRLGVWWPRGPEHSAPNLLLRGGSEMLGTNGPLTSVEFPLLMSMDSLLFAINRIIARL